ncbi:MAG: TRAP transporter large permease [Clostridiales Family XIII bacterium]|jgi:tripartite ATP-independent transporter DctM subunit|nr:TRAP transporter large permease [Clostridiales Family XIII bacterium]
MATTVITIVAVLLIAMFCGAPVQASLGFAALVGILGFMGETHIVRFGAVAFTQATSANQMIAPLFILMAEFLARGGIAADIYDVISHALKRIKGGLALATTLASTVFAALCGSSVATAATLGRISIGSMIAKGYRKDFATGVVAAGGTLGIMIPPSMTFVLYGIITETSIAKLLIAGILPGIMLSAMFCISIIIRCKINPSLYDGSEAEKNREEDEKNETLNEMVTTAKRAEAEGFSRRKILTTIPAGILIAIVLITLYTGVATPTESAGYGAVGALIIVIALRRLTFTLMKDTVAAAVRTTCMMLFMAIMGLTLSYVVSYLGIAQGLATLIVETGTGRWTVMILLFILWLILGCLMDPGSMVVLTIPFVFSTLNELGFDPIWVGVCACLMTEVGMITPPVGLNLFVIGNVTGVKLAQVIRGSFPFVVVLLLGLVILCFFPQIALYLPSRM